MSKIGFFVELEIDPSKRETFDKHMVEHADATLNGEEGCLVFDVYVDRRDPNRYALLEVYADRAAVDTHRFSAQLAKHRSEVDPAILRRVIWKLGQEVDESAFRGDSADSP